MYFEFSAAANKMQSLQSTKVTIQTHYARIRASINKILLTVLSSIKRIKKLVHLFLSK
jgi:hypothetical protein